MASLMYWSFQHGFSNYMEQVEVEELQPIQSALTIAYDANGSWDFLKHNMQAWGLFINFLPGGSWEKLPPEMIITEMQNVPKHRPRPPRPMSRPRPPSNQPHMRPQGPLRPPADKSSLNWRLSLLDEEKVIVFGNNAGTEQPLLIPIYSHDKLIGWLSVARLRWLEQGLAAKFLSTQLIAVLISSLIALVISLLISLPLGNAIIKPVTLLMTGIRNIAAGNLTKKIKWNNNDEFKFLVEDVNELATTLQKNEELRRTMMADISHELRTPLAVLQVEIEAIQDGIRPCDNERLESLHMSVRSLSRLIDDLFDLALADSGNLFYRKREIDMSALLQRTYELYTNLFQKKAISLNIQIPEKAVIRADPDRLSQVFSNILNNSYRYTDNPGEAQITAKETSDNFVICFEDSSPGITEENLNKIFDRFYRVDKSRSRAHGGAGLGLSLCKSIIEAHDGIIKASSSSLGGVAIRIDLPLYNGRIKKVQNGKQQPHHPAG